MSPLPLLASVARHVRPASSLIRSFSEVAVRIDHLVDPVEIQDVHTVKFIVVHLLNELTICLWLHSRPVVLDAGSRGCVTQRVV